jgi:HlyD family secretion protein
LKFLVSERQNVLLVPNSALRWAPQPDQVAPESRGERSTGSGGEAQPRAAFAPGAGGEGQVRGLVWVPAGSLVRAVPVQVGLTDGSLTEVRGDGLQEGASVVVGEQQKEAGKSASTSPFTPQLFQQRGQRQ